MLEHFMKLLRVHTSIQAVHRTLFRFNTLLVSMTPTRSYVRLTQQYKNVTLFKRKGMYDNIIYIITLAIMPHTWRIAPTLIATLLVY